MDINAAFPSKYLKAADLGGREVTVTIDRVESAPVGKSQERRPVVYFIGKVKGLILNRTNAKRIAAQLGSAETTTWHGKQIRLMVHAVEFEGKMVDAIRVKPRE